MKRSNCCQAPITPPGHPESDFCSQCKEHCDVYEDEEEEMTDKEKTVEELAEECALKEGIDPNFNWAQQRGYSWCPHGTRYTFKNVFIAGYRAGERKRKAVDKARATHWPTIPEKQK